MGWLSVFNVYLRFRDRVSRVRRVSRMAGLNQNKYEVIMDKVSRVRRVSSVSKKAELII